MKFFFTQLLVLLAFAVCGQAKLVINGGIISIDNGGILLIENSDNTAITRTSAGYILSEGANNRVVWFIGTGNASTYLVPFGNTAGYLPLSFAASSGSANGRMTFSTYQTPTWKNSDYLPPGVTNVNGGGTDNSAKLVDRFWQINAQGYTTKPTLSNLTFTYSDLEYVAPNTITEGNLISQRWNNALLSWTDYLPSSVINTANNTITIASMPGNQLNDWWALVDANSPLPVTLLSFESVVRNKKVVSTWATAFESNTRSFEVWRSKTLQQFDLLGTIAAAKNSTTLLNYTLTDASPYHGTSYYRLKMIDLDGSFKWSSILKVTISYDVYTSLYPNPASTHINLSVGSDIAGKNPTASTYDVKGRLVKTFKISNTYQRIKISSLPAGFYRIHFIYDNKPQTLSFIKN